LCASLNGTVVPCTDSLATCADSQGIPAACADPGTMRRMPVCPGYFSPDGVPCGIECPVGTVCPQACPMAPLPEPLGDATARANASAAQLVEVPICWPHGNQATMLADGSFVCANSALPFLCPGGRICVRWTPGDPEPTSPVTSALASEPLATRALPLGNGWMAVTGAERAEECPPLSLCTGEASSAAPSLVGVLSALLLVLFVMIVRRYRRWRRAKERQTTSRIQELEMQMQTSVDAPDPHSTELFNDTSSYSMATPTNSAASSTYNLGTSAGSYHNGSQPLARRLPPPPGQPPRAAPQTGPRMPSREPSELALSPRTASKPAAPPPRPNAPPPPRRKPPPPPPFSQYRRVPRKTTENVWQPSARFGLDNYSSLSALHEGMQRALAAEGGEQGEAAARARSDMMSTASGRGRQRGEGGETVGCGVPGCTTTSTVASVAALSKESSPHGQGGQPPRDASDSTSIYGSPVPPDERFALAFDRLSLTVESTGVRVLQPCSGVMKPGTTVAILGPSGSGKSSFLAALTGQARAYGRVDGSLFLASDAAPTSWHRTALSSLAALVGFVPQADVMLRSLSVRSVLEFAGSWRRRGRVAQSEDIDDAVNRVLAGLDLEHVQDSLIGEERRRGISGGEVRRVNVGIELMARPSILLADEPTSGLDSAAAVRVCQLFQRVASNGVLVVCVIHQPRPEIFDMFDQLLVFGKGGILTYAGPRLGVAEYFGAHFRVLPRPGQNVADFLLDVVSDSTPEQIATLGRVWAEQHGQLPYSQPQGLSDAVGRAGPLDSAWLGSQKTASFAKVYQLCLRRTAELFLSEWRAERTFAVLFFVIGMIVGILVPFTSFRYRVQAILLTSLSCGLAASYRSLNTFGDKLSVIWRESRAGMNRPAFYLGTLTFEVLVPNIYLPFCLMMGLFFLLGPHGSFGEMYLAVTLGFWPFAALGRLMSMIMARETSQMATVLLIIGLHLNGSMLPTINELASFPSVNSETIARALLASSPARWLAEYMFAIELGAFPPSRELEADAELDFYSYRRDAPSIVSWALILQGIVFDALALAAMMLLHRPEQNRAKWKTVVKDRLAH